MTTILIACAALAATLLVVTVFFLGRRSGSAAEARLNAVAAQIDERMQTMVQDLSLALDRAQKKSTRSRGPAIDSARRLRDARQLADLDALTGLHNRRYFHETLAREVARAQRYRRSLALVVFDLDDFKAVNDRIGHLAGDGVLAEAAERVRDVIRSADVACRVGGDEFAVILPESSLRDADQLYARLERALSSRPLAQAWRLHLSAGVTELRPDDDVISFFERADEALYRAKRAGKGTIVAIETPMLLPREAPGTASSL